MAKVLGVGGVFFKAEDTAALTEWYKRVLGFAFEDWGGVVFPPLPSGVTVWSPMPLEAAGYFAPSTQPFMVNLVVDELDAMVARVEEAGVEVLGREEKDAHGRFAWLIDPAGVKIELWEPKREEQVA